MKVLVRSCIKRLENVALKGLKVKEVITINLHRRSNDYKDIIHYVITYILSWLSNDGDKSEK